MAYNIKNIFNTIFIVLITFIGLYLFVNLLIPLLIVVFIGFLGFTLFKKIKKRLFKSRSDSKIFNSENPEVYNNNIDEFDLSDKTVIDVDYKKAD